MRRSGTIIMTVFTAALLTAGGCSTYPRYRTGGAEVPQKIEAEKPPFTTDEYVRFGLIIQGYLGKPYSGTSQYDPGIDCSMFTREVYRRYNGTELPRTSGAQHEIGKDIHRRLLQFGDLLFFRTDGRSISHVGIYVGHDEFVHATNSNGVIVSSLHEKYWAQRYAGARRVPGNLRNE